MIKALHLTAVERAVLHDLLQEQVNKEKDENIVFLYNKILDKIEACTISNQ